jgi:hypothetical protein
VDFKNPRNLSVNQAGFTEYAAFMADKMGSVYIYLFKIDLEDNLICAGTFDAGSTGKGVDFKLGESFAGVCDIYVTEGGVLSCFSGAGSESGQLSKYDISPKGETVECYGVIKKPETREHYGWYSLLRGADARDIELFLIRENGSVLRHTLAGYSDRTRIRCTAGMNGAVYYTITDGTEAAVFQGTSDGFFRSVAFSAPVIIEDYRNAALNGFPFGVLTGGAENNRRLYGITGEDSAVPKINGWPPIDEINVRDFIILNKERVLIV